jgi:23S rRNA pseudouridine1911/1915/1917 synthase
MPRERKFKVTSAEKDLRLDVYLTGKDLGLSRSHNQVLIKTGQVAVNGLRKKASHKLKPGEEIVVNIPEPRKLELEPENIPLDILYEDGEIIVVNKPAGMVVHPAAGNYSGTLVSALLYHCENLSGINGILRPGIVHRLDKETSGVLVIAKTDAAHLNLARQFEERKVKKKYLALVHDNIKEEEVTIDTPIARHSRNRKKMAVVPGGREAITRFKVLERFRDYTLLEVTPYTGRTHQIRVHLAHIKHPLLGDALYGRKKKKKMEINRQGLHAYSLGFSHPLSGEYREFIAPLPWDMRKFIENSLTPTGCK